jgi:uncharacterized membrane protein
MERLTGPGETQGMTNTLRTSSIVASTLTMGLAAGLFATFAYAIMPGLHRADDRTFVIAMQRVNESILNGWFALCFGGALVFTALAVITHLRAADRKPLGWLIAGLVLYVIVLIVTFAINVPLNDKLAAAGRADQVTDVAAVRAHFESTWVTWNIVRAFVSTAAFGCVTGALSVAGR